MIAVEPPFGPQGAARPPPPPSDSTNDPVEGKAAGFGQQRELGPKNPRIASRGRSRLCPRRRRYVRVGLALGISDDST